MVMHPIVMRSDPFDRLRTNRYNEFMDARSGYLELGSFVVGCLASCTGIMVTCFCPANGKKVNTTHMTNESTNRHVNWRFQHTNLSILNDGARGAPA